MGELPEPVAALAQACGVATSYLDWRGRHIEVPLRTIEAVLGALGWDASSPQSARRCLDALLSERRERLLPPILTVPQESSVPLDLPAQAQAWVELEEGGRVDVVGADPRVLPSDLPLGWHTLHARDSRTGAARCPLVVTPARLRPPVAARAWGYQAQLYQVRTQDSWGIGDLGDLGELLEFSAGLGAGFAVINPLYAAAPVTPIEESPYLPTSRRFLSPLYLRVTDIAELADCPGPARARVDTLAAGFAASPGPADLLDRDRCWTAKREALELIHRAGRSSARQAEFDAYAEREGETLREFATWCALVEVYGPEWTTWPEELRDPASAAVGAERERRADRVDFHAWLQWQLEDQLARAGRRGAEAGMPIGVIGDLPVGVHPRGFESWSLAHVLAVGVSVGAPPDAFTPKGQDWSQPPWKPNRLAELGYAPFRDMIRGLLRHSGGIRVDHVMGMFRLWWIPEGARPGEGTYVRYDHEAMVGILALEAHRAGAVVIGEDLGTVEPWVREYLAERGILGTSVLFFERDSGGPKPAARWREFALATVTTHDLPPTAGYLTGEHVAVRDRLGLLEGPAEPEWAGLAEEIASWRDRLLAEGIDPGAPGDTEAMVSALHRFLARTPAVLCGISLADAAGDRRTLNQPGTHREYPNWALPLRDPDGRAVLLADLRASPRPAALAAIFAAGRAAAADGGFATLQA